MSLYTDECLHAANHGLWLGDRPEDPTAKRPLSIRVFRSSFLEVFSRSHPITPGVWFGPIILWAWLTSPRVVGWLPTAAVFLAGVLVFTLFEYGLHRVVFHGLIRAAENQESARFMAFMAHGYHHEFPNDRSRLVMPPMISWPLALLFGSVYWLLLGPAYYLPMLAGTMAGYIAYDWVHYYTHHFHPKGGLGKWLRAYHMRHHFQDHDAFYGISSPLWDLVFRTYRSPLPVKREALEG